MTVGMLELVQKLTVAAEELGDPAVCRLVESVEEHAQAATLQILVVGATGSGRASVVNALLGCPDLVPQTAVPKALLSLRLRHGSAAATEALDSDGGRMALPANRLRSLLCDPTAAARYRAVEMAAPCASLETCEVSVEALDADRSPGEWRDLLAGSDFIIVVLNATALLSQRERDFIREHLAGEYGLHRVALVINRMDLVPEEERASILELVRAYLGPFQSQPAVLDVSAIQSLQSDSAASHAAAGVAGSSVSVSENASETSVSDWPDRQLRTLLEDLVDRHAAVRAVALREACAAALEELADVAARQRAAASMDREEADRLRQSIEARRDWLRGRIERTQRRVDAFVGTLLREQLQQEVQGFGEVFRRRLPDEIRSVDDLSTIRRYLPGYIETVWKDVLQERMIAVRSRLLEEAGHLERMIEGDLRELLESALGDLHGSMRGFDPVAGRLQAFVAPKRGKHSASTVARGLGLHGFVMLIVASIFGISPIPGLLSLGASQVVRRIFQRDIETDDREAIIAAATAAERELERELRKQIDQQFSQLKGELQKEVASQYAEGVKRVEELLEENQSRGKDAAARREQLAALTERTIPELRTLLQHFDGQGAA